MGWVNGSIHSDWGKILPMPFGVMPTMKSKLYTLLRNILKLNKLLNIK